MREEKNQDYIFFWKIAIKNTKTIFLTTIIILITSIVGITKLEVENSFINYFDKDIEIYKGMKLIDNNLGGTTPLNIILKFPNKEKEENDDDWEEEGQDDASIGSQEQN